MHIAGRTFHVVDHLQQMVWYTQEGPVSWLISSLLAYHAQFSLIVKGIPTDVYDKMSAFLQTVFHLQKQRRQ